MANVLPEDAQKHIRRTERARFVLVGSLALSLCALVALLSLLPAYTVVRASTAPTTAILAKSDKDKGEQAGVARAQLLVKQLSTLATSTTPGIDVLLLALDAKPKSVLIQKISLVPGNAGQIVLEGTAASREDINAYVAVLRANTYFKSVSIPIGALAGADAGHFSMTLTGTF